MFFPRSYLRDTELSSLSYDRFTVEPVEEPPLSPDNVAVGSNDTNAPTATRTRRSGQPILSMLYQMSSKAVSRPPLLSAIEETNTVNSLQQILSSGSLDYPTEAAAEETRSDEETSGAEKSRNRYCLFENARLRFQNDLEILVFVLPIFKTVTCG